MVKYISSANKLSFHRISGNLQIVLQDFLRSRKQKFFLKGQYSSGKMYMRMFPEIQYWVTSFFLFILTANPKVSNPTQNSLQMRFLYFWQSVTVNYSRSPLFRMLLISNIRYSEQNFRSLEFTLKNSMLLISNPVISNISLFRKFFPAPWHEYRPLIRIFIERWSKTSFFFYYNCKFISSIFKFQINVQNFTFFGSHSFIQA